MRKTYLFLSLMIAILALYCIGWRSLSNVIKDKVYENLDKLKAARMISAYSGDIDVTGFPFALNIKFIHPRLQFKQPNITGDLLFDGVFTTRVSFFSSKVMLNLNGDLHFKSSLNDRNFDLTLNAKDLSFNLALNDTVVISSIKAAMANSTDTTSPMRFLKGVSVNVSDLSLINKLTNKTLVYTEEWTSNTEFSQSHNELEVRHEATANNTEFNSEFNILTNAIVEFRNIRAALDKLDSNIRNYFTVFSPDKLGKINYDVDAMFRSNPAEISIKIHKFKIQDALHNISLSGALNFANKTKIDTTFAGTFSPQWYRLAQVYANKLDLRGILADKNFSSRRSQSIFATIFSAVAKFVKEAFLNRGDHSAYVPQLHEMGQIKGNIALSYARLSPGMRIDIDAFKINAKDIGLNLHGYINSPENSGDTYSLKAKLNNYSRLVDYGVGYINRITASMRYAFFISDKQLHLSPSVQNSIKLFMRELSDEPASTSQDLNMTVVNKDGGKYPSVGRYSSQAFSQMWNNFVWRVILSEIASTLNPQDLLKLLTSPEDLPTTISKNMAQQAQKLAEGIFGILGVQT